LPIGFVKWQEFHIEFNVTFEPSIEVSILSIHLHDNRPFLSSKGQENSKGSRTNSRSESICVINAILLLKTFGNKLGLVTDNSSFVIAFSAEYIVGWNNIGARRGYDQIPGAQFLDLE